MSTKQSLDQILSSLDSDPPTYQRRDDLTALNIYFSAIRIVANDIQRHIGRLNIATTGRPSYAWSSVQSLWDTADIKTSEERLGRQVRALAVYISIAEVDEKSRHFAKLRHAQDLNSARDDALTFIDADVATSFDAPPPYEEMLPTDDGLALQSTSNTSALPHGSQSSSENTDGLSRPSVSPVNRSLQGTETDSVRPDLTSGSQPSNMADPSASSSLVLARSTLALVAFNSPNAIVSSQSSPQASSSTSRAVVEESSEGPPPDGLCPRTKSGLSARRIKSLALLRKPKTTPLSLDRTRQGDLLNPGEFKSRVSSYTSGVTPSWRMVTLIGKENSVQRYRNRFTKDPADDISPSKMQGTFKITDRELWDAILHKEAAKVAEIMQHRWSDNVMVEKQDSLMALHMAASLGLCGIVQILLATGANPNCSDRFGVTPLHYAADFGCANCLRILVAAGAKVDGVPPKASLKPPIWYAAEKGHVEAVNILLKLGAHFVNQITTVKESLLHIAVKSGSMPICESLLAIGANPNESFSTLLMAASRSPEILGCLRKAGADIDMRDTNGETLLHKHVASGDVPMARFILSLGADPNLKDDFGRSPLHAAVADGGPEVAPEMVKRLRKKGANINAQNSLGQTPLHMAILWGRADVVHMLYQSGADLNVADETGTSAWAEAQKPDYTSRTTRNGFADYRKSKHIMEQWFGKAARRKPTVTPELPASPVPRTTNHRPEPAAASVYESSRVSLHELADTDPFRQVYEMPA
ncbi:hypothetical protein DL762_010134 [Monosporascus cannonballus]|uniref:Uncharacterized protein n=1 Tax=Monosporascus cannonballus TaxID=155416 RepID=A0ABY0GRT1_9PEZI|nr:hypothetical protein DL762_010134 [Monosporascus cannonballus]RYO89939.1 hypothetical protein DL763_005495 [Monosporascus cannonballus]